MKEWNYPELHPEMSLVTVRSHNTWEDVLAASAEFAGRCEGHRIGAGATIGAEARVIIASGVELMIGQTPTTPGEPAAEVVGRSLPSSSSMLWLRPIAQAMHCVR